VKLGLTISDDRVRHITRLIKARADDQVLELGEIDDLLREAAQ
jgi:hypothetical protein